tara:strand:- start:62 stop:859 length:798 start_codon:yes stop_codon:yes gene_type:complete
MKFSILINTHNQEQYLNRTIKSCIDQSFEKFEIIIVDSSDKKNYNINRKLNLRKKISYFHIKSKYKQPEINQMKKILFGFRKSKGDFICLMDGDDFFHKNKLKQLNKLIKKKTILFNQDKPILYDNKTNNKKLISIKKYKNNSLFNILINNWPQIYGTSSIVVKKEILKKFFQSAKPFNWKYLAIDAQLAIFCNIRFRMTSDLDNITIKTIHNNNLGSKYLNIFKQKFWERRYMQHKYYSFLKKRSVLNFDLVFTAIFYYFFKNL